MHDLLVVDDDFNIRDGLRRMLQPIADGRTIHVAENGKTALEIVCAHPVGIIFSDVKMPLCDGIALLKGLRALSYLGEIVMISGFDDYALVRASMKLGASDYLLKPVDIHELHAVYRHCIEKLAQSAPASLMNESLTTKIYAEQAEISRLFLENKASACSGEGLLFLIDHDKDFDLAEDTRRAAFQLGLEITAQALAALPYQLVQGVHKSRWILWLRCDNAEAALDAMRQALGRGSIRFGASLLRKNPKETLRRAEKQLESYFYDYSPGEVPLAEEYPFAKTAEGLIKAVLALDHAAMEEALRRLTCHIALSPPSVRDTRKLYASLVYELMAREKHFIKIVGTRKFTEEDIIYAIQSAESLSMLKKTCQSLLHVYIGAYAETVAQKDIYAIQKAKQYIEESYMSGISLSEMADILKLHPNYLSSLFHQQVGETFGSYLRKARIGHAIRLMQSSNYKIYEIAAMVGYNDTTQFHRAFKQVTGVAPGKYKHRSLP